jgi:hypothetical protein
VPIHEKTNAANRGGARVYRVGETQKGVKRIRQPEKPPLLRQLDCKKLFTKSHLFVGIFWIGLRNVAAGGGTAARCGSLKVAAA